MITILVWSIFGYLLIKHVGEDGRSKNGWVDFSMAILFVTGTFGMAVNGSKFIIWLSTTKAISWDTVRIFLWKWL